MSRDPRIILHGPGSDEDRTEVEGLIALIASDETEDLELTRNFTGELVFDVRMRFVDGVLNTVDHSLNRRRRRVYS